MTILRGWFAITLWKRVVAGLVLGALLGMFWPDAAPAVKIVGDLFVRLIKMLVVPVVLITIAAGIAGLGDPRRLGPIGGRTIGQRQAVRVEHAGFRAEVIEQPFGFERE